MALIGFIFSLVFCLAITFFAVAIVWASKNLDGEVPALVLLIALVAPATAWYLTITNAPVVVSYQNQGGAE